MATYELNREGFITQYLISGLREVDFIDNTVDDDQIRYETYLRSIITKKQEHSPEGDICLGEDSPLGMPWRYYYNHENWFVDLSTFYSVLTSVEMDACTQLVAENDMEIKAIIWSYASVDVWCEGIHVSSMSPPVYKPIKKQEVTLNLKQGRNLLYIRLQTLGVRDTRTLFGIQILDGKEKIKVGLPDQAHTEPVAACVKWLVGAKIYDGKIRFSSPAPEGTTLEYDFKSPDYAKTETRVMCHDISGVSCETLEKGYPYLVVTCQIEGQTLKRQMEDISQIHPQVLEHAGTIDWEENTRVIFNRTADVESLSRGGKFGFSISNILARKATNRVQEKDRELFLETLSQIEMRYDCSDFLVCGLIRYLKNYEIDTALETRVKEVLLNYRYWMDQEGSDAMCFWSENHSLMFYVSAMNAGEYYPDEYFVRAGMTGRQLYVSGKARVEQWLDDVEEHGFEEFLSTVYMCVTFAGLLNAIDYTTEEIGKRASMVTDTMLTMLAQHTYKGSVIAPQGRVYRQIIYPFLQGAQALMNLVNPEIPYAYGEGWLAFYATSKYKIPKGLKEMMEQSISMEYDTGNARVCLEKNADFCMTSVCSPRMDQEFKRWTNLTLEQEKTLNTHEYTKSLNERFHGTTCFEPGVYGYQQHMWSAALDVETQVFTNHPGGTSDSSQMRPGFWFGNGVMPAIQQKQGVLGAIYVIPPEHPIHFTHVFWPGVKFERMREEEHWLFGQKDSGYIAIWCNQVMEVHQDQIFDCEYRSYGDVIAYACICAGNTMYQDLEAFIQNCKEHEPVFNQEQMELKAGAVSLTYEKQEDKTQYI